jgi:hypothetical protein
MRRYLPDDMVRPPHLDHAEGGGAIQQRYALLINPFYPKDPNASFGKHVLTPTLALTSFAATTPAHWTLRYWDENLLDGRPPASPVPEVVGITVHLTFAKRAFELARWYRSRGSKVILGGLHALSCPEECAPHADALALGDGVQLWPRILADVESGLLQIRYTATYENDYCAAPLHPAAEQFSDHDEPDCHARLSQSLRVLLSRHRGTTDAVPHARPGAGGRGISGRRSAVRRLHRQ